MWWWSDSRCKLWEKLIQRGWGVLLKSQCAQRVTLGILFKCRFGLWRIPSLALVLHFWQAPKWGCCCWLIKIPFRVVRSSTIKNILADATAMSRNKYWSQLRLVPAVQKSYESTNFLLLFPVLCNVRFTWRLVLLRVPRWWPAVVGFWFIHLGCGQQKTVFPILPTKVLRFILIAQVK